MKLAVHSDAVCLNENKAHSTASVCMLLSEDDHIPTFNSVILTISQIIKFVMYSVTEAELASFFVTAKNL